MTTLLWFRDDLRLHDNPALCWAAERGEVIACVVDEPVYAGEPASREIGSAAAWWRERSLARLAAALRKRHVPLHRLRGDAREVIPEFAASRGVRAACWNRRYHLPGVDAAVKDALRERDVEAHSFAGHLMVEPQAIKPYKVYSAFARAARVAIAETLEPPLGVPEFAGPGGIDWREAPAPHWAAKLAKCWTPGEDAAREALDGLDLSVYDRGRDVPARPATSRLSPHLRFGEVSVREVWQHASALPADASTFHSELLWRDFAWHRLHHVPTLATEPVRAQFRNFDWYWDGGGVAKHGPDPRPHALPELSAWRHAATGIALVDAGLAELWATGHMHNRVRMVVGSFLTKNLGIHWRHGEEWFWDTLVDADPASNPFNWQWVAGCGDDAAPYFRIFNPELQAKKFDPQGAYVARWAPTVSATPIVDLAESRAAALAAYSDMKAAAEGEEHSPRPDPDL